MATGNCYCPSAASARAILNTEGSPACAISFDLPWPAQLDFEVCGAPVSRRESPFMLDGASGDRRIHRGWWAPPVPANFDELSPD